MEVVENLSPHILLFNFCDFDYKEKKIPPQSFFLCVVSWFRKATKDIGSSSIRPLVGHNTLSLTCRSELRWVMQSPDAAKLTSISNLATVHGTQMEHSKKEVGKSSGDCGL